MSIEDNKALVLRACQHISDRNLPALFDLIDDKGSWTVPYRADRFEFGGFRDKAGLLALFTQFFGGFDRFSFTVTTITAEDDRVAIEARSSGTGPGSAQYENVYNLIFVVKDGKLHTVREYFDPFQVIAYVEQIVADQSA